MSRRETLGVAGQWADEDAQRLDAIERVFGFVADKWIGVMFAVRRLKARTQTS